MISKKNKIPDYNLFPSYSPIFNMKRIGYKGKTIGVYKLRTMYPYSEYLQEFIIKENKLSASEKLIMTIELLRGGNFAENFGLMNFQCL